MEKKPSWDDIPSLKLEMDDESSGDASRERRKAGRLTSKDIANLVIEDIKSIPVQIGTRKKVLNEKGSLENINENGMCFVLSGHGLKELEPVKVATAIGKQIISANAVVRWQTNDKVGVEFIEIEEEYASFLKELFSAKAFNFRI